LVILPVEVLVEALKVMGSPTAAAVLSATTSAAVLLSPLPINRTAPAMAAIIKTTLNKIAMAFVDGRFFCTSSGRVRLSAPTINVSSPLPSSQKGRIIWD
jgi:pyrimidine deaminase RibD-like protein